MKYKAKNFDHLLGTPGFSDQLLMNHFALYQGYVATTNKFAQALAHVVRDARVEAPEYATLKRRFGWEFNGMRLHEYYFSNMANGGKPLDKGSAFFKQLLDDFGSYGNWEKDFKATGTIRGIGWVVLYLDPLAHRTFNAWINEHDLGHLAGGIPLLIMDVFEHAYMTDYGLKRVDYIEAFFQAIDWEMVASRFNNALRAVL
ncbi:MAG: Fe-Mn family superoxide dismutase [Acidobacteriota bacterium]|nr:Fe-Mn family superoxide dismutase [Blastocatellia bacterium]MDW8238208.1 Fe-Mn family superoxide dismutase [Acidobacteriota bacterium]